MPGNFIEIENLLFSLNKAVQMKHSSQYNLIWYLYKLFYWKIKFWIGLMSKCNYKYLFNLILTQNVLTINNNGQLIPTFKSSKVTPL